MSGIQHPCLFGIGLVHCAVSVRILSGECFTYSSSIAFFGQDLNEMILFMIDSMMSYD